jgi:hypothetical protein
MEIHQKIENMFRHIISIIQILHCETQPYIQKRPGLETFPHVFFIFEWCFKLKYFEVQTSSISKMLLHS